MAGALTFEGVLQILLVMIQLLSLSYQGVCWAVISLPFEVKQVVSHDLAPLLLRQGRSANVLHALPMLLGSFLPTPCH